MHQEAQCATVGEICRKVVHRHSKSVAHGLTPREKYREQLSGARFSTLNALVPVAVAATAPALSQSSYAWHLQRGEKLRVVDDEASRRHLSVAEITSSVSRATALRSRREGRVNWSMIDHSRWRVVLTSPSTIS